MRDWIYATLKWPSIVSYIEDDNEPSIRLLGRIGLRFDRTISPPGRAEVLRLFTTDPA